MRNRIELAKHFRDQGFLKGAEIGVCDGRYSEILLETIPGLELKAIDSWEGEWAAPYEEAKRKLSGRCSIIKGQSVEIAESIPEGSLDFVFIDAEHSYESVKADIEAWAPKVRNYGIVAGHDYYLTRQGNLGVIKAVNEYADKHGCLLNFTWWDLDAYEDDRQPCWWFTQEVK